MSLHEDENLTSQATKCVKITQNYFQVYASRFQVTNHKAYNLSVVVFKHHRSIAF